MYESFFALTMKPFELVPNPDMLFPSRAHRKAQNYLEYGFKEGAGFMLLTGEIGSGKTTLLRNLIKLVDKKTPRAMIFNTMVRPKQLLAMINEEFGLDATGKDKILLLRELNDYLVEQCAMNHRPMVIIDEAQNLSAQALEEIRLLSNLELDSAKLLQIVLVGQPELKDLITKPCLRQLQQRISINCHLSAMEKDETEGYILHRLEKAGNREAVIFEDGAFDLIHEFSDGLPRLINIYCDFILLAAFVEGTRELSQELVRDVLDDLILSRTKEEELDLPDKAVISLEGLLERLDESYAELFNQKTSIGVIEERLTNHENIIRKVVKTQQEQIKNLDATLDEINSKLAALVTESSLKSPQISPVPVAVIDSEKVTNRFWHKNL